MRLELQRDKLSIFPESEADAAFLEDTLGLRGPGDRVDLVRIEGSATGFGSATRLESRKHEEPKA